MKAIEYEFLYMVKFDEYSHQFISKKDNLIDAIQEFLTNIPEDCYEIDPEIKITYSNGTEEIYVIDVRQDWGDTFYVIHEDKMIYYNDIKPYKNERKLK